MLEKPPDSIDFNIISPKIKQENHCFQQDLLFIVLFLKQSIFHPWNID